MEIELLTIEKVVEAYGFRSQKSIRCLIDRGMLPHRKIGRSIFIPRAELEKYLAGLPGVSAEEALAKVEERAA